MAWCSEWKCHVFCFLFFVLFSMCYSVLFFGIVVTEGFHFMPNDWTFTLLFHFRSGCVWRKMHHLFFPWSFLHLVSNLALAWHFSFLSNAVGFVSFFFFFFSLPNFNFTFMSQEQTFIWRVWRYSSCLIAGSGVYEEYICCWFGRSLTVISLQQPCAQIQTDAAGSDFWWLKKKRERKQQQNSCFPIGQSALCKNGRYILTDQLYLSVCPMIVATMWTVYSGFCIVALPEPHLLYVCDVFLPFCCVFLGWYWWAVHFPGLLAPEGSKLQISVVSGQFHLKSVGVDEA